MSINKRLFVIAAIVNIINIFNIQNIFPMKTAVQPTVAKPVASQPIQAKVAQQPERELIKQIFREELGGMKDYVMEVKVHAAKSADDSCYAARLSFTALEDAIKTREQTIKTSALATQITLELEQAKAMQANLVKQEIPATIANLKHECGLAIDAITAEAVKAKERVSEAAKIERALKVEEQIKINVETEKVIAELGVNENVAKIKAASDENVAKTNAQGRIDAEKEKSKSFRETISDPKIMAKIALAIVITALCIYAIKYGMPALMNHFTQPHVISETSRSGWLRWFKSKQDSGLDDLIFTPSLQKQLSALTLRVQSAKEYDEALPNILFYGAPGTGKTAFAKALAIASGLDYALTSGSEFAKIKNLNDANNELRKLLDWAKKSKGLIIFIDEAESLFANRKLSTTSKRTQDFINTFLSLVSDQSQKNVMFIFATNHPFKLDDAITNRIGMNIEFTLPESTERNKILFKYLLKFAQENEEAVVALHLEISQMLSKYADSLKGFSPRAIKFVAETMIINARRKASKQLTNDIAQATIDEAKNSLQKTTQWKEERNEWSGGLVVPQLK